MNISRNFGLCAADVADKPITRSWNGQDEFRLVPLFPQRLAQRRNILSQIVLFNRDARPNLLHQFIFFDHSPAVFDQIQKGLERFWR